MHGFSVMLGFLVSVLGATAVSAATGLGLNGIGGHLDYVDPEHTDAVIGLGALVDLGRIIPEIGLEGSVDYWSSSMDSLHSSTTSRAISISVTGRYSFAVNDESLRPFAGVGLAMHLWHWRDDYDAGYVPDPGSGREKSGSDLKLGFDVCGGAFYGVSRNLDLLGELRYRMVSDVNQVVLRAGVVYRLGN